MIYHSTYLDYLKHNYHQNYIIMALVDEQVRVLDEFVTYKFNFMDMVIKVEILAIKVSCTLDIFIDKIIFGVVIKVKVQAINKIIASGFIKVYILAIKVNCILVFINKINARDFPIPNKQADSDDNFIKSATNDLKIFSVKCFHLNQVNVNRNHLVRYNPGFKVQSLISTTCHYEYRFMVNL